MAQERIGDFIADCEARLSEGVSKRQEHGEFRGLVDKLQGLLKERTRRTLEAAPLQEWEDGEVVAELDSTVGHVYLHPGGQGIISHQRTEVKDDSGRLLTVKNGWVLNGTEFIDWTLSEEQDVGEIGIVERRGEDLFWNGSKKPFYRGVETSCVVSRRGDGSATWGEWKIGADGVYVQKGDYENGRTLFRVSPVTGRKEKVYTFPPVSVWGARDISPHWAPTSTGFMVYDRGRFLMDGVTEISRVDSSRMSWLPVLEGVLIYCTDGQDNYPVHSVYLNETRQDNPRSRTESARQFRRPVLTLPSRPIFNDEQHLIIDGKPFAPAAKKFLVHPSGGVLIRGDDSAVRYYSFP